MPSKENAGSIAIAFWGILLVVCLAGWSFLVVYGDPSRAWRALLINFLFFTPLAGGMIVWPAIVVVSQGRWAGPLERAAFASLYFAPVSLAALIALWIGQSHWATRMADPELPQGFWLNGGFVFVRDFLAIAILWVLCAAFVHRRRKGTSAILAGWLCFSYGVVFTLIAFDRVMALDPRWFSALFGGYFFVSGMYAALAAWTLLSVVSGIATAEHRHDLGKLIVAVSLFTGYLMYSQLLPIWYGNLLVETRFVIPRLTETPWRWVSAVLVVAVYLGPLVLLLTRRSKRSPEVLVAVSLLMLVGLWVERWWEVAPTLGGELRLGLSEVGITLAFIAAFVLSAMRFAIRSAK